jgi:Phosphotransferase system cellobiose-specific component IIA
MEEILMQILVNGGSARAQAIAAIRSAREGDLESAKKLLMDAQELIAAAHAVQTDLIQSEARGERSEVSLFMVHAQDHIMNAITVKELAEEMVEEIALRLKLQEKLGVDVR